MSSSVTRKRFTSLITAAAVVCLCMSVLVYAQDNKPNQGDAKEVSQKDAVKKDAKSQSGSTKNRKPEKKSSSNAPRRAPNVTPEQAAAVHALVNQHHPDLASLLKQLKEARPAQYTQAVRALFRTSVRLANIQERDMERYDLELKRWKLESQSQLLALKAVRSKNDTKLLKELEATSRALLETRIALVELDQARQRERLRKLEEQLSALRSGQEQHIDANVQSLLRSARSLAQRASKDKNKTKRSGSPVKAEKAKKVD